MFTREEDSATYIHTHTSLINESSAALTNYPTPADSCIGPACEAGLSIDACVNASPQIVNRDPDHDAEFLKDFLSLHYVG